MVNLIKLRAVNTGSHLRLHQYDSETSMGDGRVGMRSG